MSRRSAIFLLCCLAVAGIVIGERIDHRRQERAMRDAADRMEHDRVNGTMQAREAWRNDLLDEVRLRLARGDDPAKVKAWAAAASPGPAAPPPPPRLRPPP